MLAQMRGSPAGRVQQQPNRPPVTVQQTPQLTHAQPNYQSMMQNMRAMQTPHAQAMHQQQHQFPANPQAAATAGATQQGQQGVQLGQDQQMQMLQQYQMYSANYPQMVAQMQRGGMSQPGYAAWTAAVGAGRGVVPNISGHPQQMQLGAGKAGMQGSS